MSKLNRYLWLLIYVFVANADDAWCQTFPIEYSGGFDNEQDYIRPAAGLVLPRDQIRNQGDPFGEHSSVKRSEEPPNLDYQRRMSTKGYEMDHDKNPIGDLAPPYIFEFDRETIKRIQEDPRKQAKESINRSSHSIPPTEEPANGWSPFLVDGKDPDTSAQLQDSWKSWFQAVDEAIFTRFDAYARKAFATSRPLKCKVSYRVTRDRQIVDVVTINKSPSIVFNTMVLLVLKSMNGNPILEFPPGSKRAGVVRVRELQRNLVGDFGYIGDFGPHPTTELQIRYLKSKDRNLPLPKSGQPLQQIQEQRYPR